MDALDAPGVQFDGGQVAVRAGQFQQVPALAARRGAGVEDTHATVHQEPWRGNLRGRVLHGYVAARETRQPCDRQRRGQANRVHEPGHEFVTVFGLGISCQVVRCGQALAVDAQPHRRPAVVCFEDAFPVLWPVLPQGIDEPGRMIEPGFVILGFRIGEILPNEIAQHRVDQSDVLGAAQDPRRFDRYRYRGMIGYARIGELEQADRQQRLDDAVALFQWTVEQFCDVCAQAKMMAQGAVTQHLDQRLASEVDVLAVLLESAVQ